jgi:hypothetical protein
MRCHPFEDGWRITNGRNGQGWGTHGLGFGGDAEFTCVGIVMAGQARGTKTLDAYPILDFQSTGGRVPTIVPALDAHNISG